MIVLAGVEENVIPPEIVAEQFDEVAHVTALDRRRDGIDADAVAVIADRPAGDLPPFGKDVFPRLRYAGEGVITGQPMQIFSLRLSGQSYFRAGGRVREEYALVASFLSGNRCLSFFASSMLKWA